MKLKLEIGWFSSEPCALLHFELFEQWNAGGDDFTIISIQIAKFAISLIFCED